MSARSFRSVFMVASCAGAALGCYLVSLRVASERAALEEVETRIVLAERDIRLLETEIGTRGRLAQLERWNVRVLALSAPSADQFVEGGFALASLVRPETHPAIDSPVVLASAPSGNEPAGDSATTAPEGQSDRLDTAPVRAKDLLRHASLTDPVPAVTPVKKAGDKPDARAGERVTKPVRSASIDPLAPLPPASAKHAKVVETAR